jgi:hypothetical protein
VEAGGGGEGAEEEDAEGPEENDADAAHRAAVAAHVQFIKDRFTHFAHREFEMPTSEEVTDVVEKASRELTAVQFRDCANVGRCKLSVSRPELKARLISAHVNLYVIM